jgi:hypothetical protein
MRLPHPSLEDHISPMPLPKLWQKPWKLRRATVLISEHAVFDSENEPRTCRNGMSVSRRMSNVSIIAAEAAAPWRASERRRDRSGRSRSA